MLKTPRNIIIEGVECAGKTTLIDALSRECRGWDIKYLPHKDGNQFKRYVHEYLTNEKTIFNRSHLSEVVCGSLWRGGPGMSEEETSTLNKLVGEEFVVVLVDADPEVIKQRFRERGYVEGAKIDEVEAVQKGFKNAFENVTHITCVSNDEDDLKRNVGTIAKFMRGIADGESH
jgi:thymidylate kinase